MGQIKMTKVKISSTIIDEICLRELWNYGDKARFVYAKIRDTKSTRKSGSIVIDVDADELNELFQEADSWSGSFDDYTMPKGEWLAWKALRKQIKSKM